MREIRNLPCAGLPKIKRYVRKDPFVEKVAAEAFARTFFEA